MLGLAAIVFATGCNSLPASSSNAVQVFILAGQSNMEGQGVVDMDHPRYYNGGKGIVVDALIEPVKVFNNRYSAYLDLFIRSNTDRLSDFLAVNLGPNIDISIGDGSVLNIGVTLGLSGDAKQQETGLNFILLRNM